MVCGTASDLKYCLTLKHQELGKEDVLDQEPDVVLCTRCESLAIGKFHTDTLHSGNQWIFVANG